MWEGITCIAKARPPSLNYKIRQLTTNNQTGDAFGITVPAKIAIQFSNIKFQLMISGNSLIYTSGTAKRV